MLLKGKGDSVGRDDRGEVLGVDEVEDKDVLETDEVEDDLVQELSFIGERAVEVEGLEDEVVVEVEGVGIGLITVEGPAGGEARFLIHNTKPRSSGHTMSSTNK